MIYLFINAWKYSGEDRWRVILFSLLHIVSFGGELVQPYAFGLAINALQTNGTEHLFPTLKWFGIYLVGFLIFQFFHHTARYFQITTAFRNQKRFINEMYIRIYRLPMKWHVDHHSGQTVNRINIAGQALRDFGFNQHNYLGNLLLSFGPIILLTSISWRISGICLLLTAINLAVVQKINKSIQPLLYKQNENFHAFIARLIDFVGNIKTIISLRLEQRTSEDLDRKFGDYYHEHMREFWINQPRCFIMAFGAILTELIVILYYIWSCKISHQLIMLGTLIIIVNYFRQIRDAFFKITDSFYETLHWKASLQAVDPIIKASRQQDFFPTNQEYCSCWHQLSIKNLSFKYQTRKYVLQNLEMEISKKSKIAIVGLSGSGKSTLLNILAGLYQPEKIRLLLDSEEYSSTYHLAKSAILVPQDPEVFENTIHYNITFGLGSENSKLDRVIDITQLGEVINRLPNGIKTDIREKGVNLSGGEKQRLGLARGLFFFQGKRMLLLDEVTSNLDAYNERLIFQQIIQNYQEYCLICTIHRLHLLEMFDTVLVMNEGKIVQKGELSELIRSEGHFQKLWEKYLISVKK